MCILPKEVIDILRKISLKRDFCRAEAVCESPQLSNGQHCIRLFGRTCSRKAGVTQVGDDFQRITAVTD